MLCSERIATYIFYFQRTSGHKDIISWSPPFHLHCCPIAVTLSRQTVYTSSKKHSILNAYVEKPTKIERAEVMMQNKKRRTRRSHGDDDKDSPEAIVK